MNNDVRIKRANLYSAGIYNRMIARHPKRVSCDIIYNVIERDIYGDLHRIEEGSTTKKFVIFQSDKSLQFVPTSMNSLRLEDSETPYWYILMTITSLIRGLHQGDYLRVATEVFSNLYPTMKSSCTNNTYIDFEVAAIQPISASIHSVFYCICHPTKETFDLHEPL